MASAVQNLQHAAERKAAGVLIDNLIKHLNKKETRQYISQKLAIYNH